MGLSPYKQRGNPCSEEAVDDLPKSARSHSITLANRLPGFGHLFVKGQNRAEKNL